MWITKAVCDAVVDSVSGSSDVDKTIIYDHLQQLLPLVDDLKFGYLYRLTLIYYIIEYIANSTAQERVDFVNRTTSSTTGSPAKKLMLDDETLDKCVSSAICTIYEKPIPRPDYLLCDSLFYYDDQLPDETTHLYEVRRKYLRYRSMIVQDSGRLSMAAGNLECSSSMSESGVELPEDASLIVSSNALLPIEYSTVISLQPPEDSVLWEKRKVEDSEISAYKRSEKNRKIILFTIHKFVTREVAFRRLLKICENQDLIGLESLLHQLLSDCVTLDDPSIKQRRICCQLMRWKLPSVTE